MKILIIGGCGFLGSNLASHGIGDNHEITIFDNLSRVGASSNLKWLRTLGEFTFFHGDVRVKNDVENVIKGGVYDAIFHLAGQVAMTTSIENPYKDFETNTMGLLNSLDSIRKYSPNTAIFFSSTNKVYGDLEQYNYSEASTRYICEDCKMGFDEAVPLDFRSPYGCSKGAADQYMLDYYRIFGIKSVVFRHSSMYGSRQYSTNEQGWVGWFCKQAVDKCLGKNVKPFTISGNGKQVRDVLHARDMMRLYYDALDNIDKVAGNVYNIGGTMEQSLSLLELFELLSKMLDVKLEYTQLPPRISDQKVFVADISKIKREIGWSPTVKAEDGITEMIQWVKDMR